MLVQLHNNQITFNSEDFSSSIKPDILQEEPETFDLYFASKKYQKDE